MVQAIRAPGQWARAQREFREGYEADPEGVVRQDAHIEWWVNQEPAAQRRAPGILGLFAGLGGLLGQWWAGRGMSEGGFVAVYAPTTAPGARPVMVFPVSEEITLPVGANGAGTGPGVVAGEIGLNGCCCVELPDGTVLWPAYNPTVPTIRPRSRR